MLAASRPRRRSGGAYLQKLLAYTASRSRSRTGRIGPAAGAGQAPRAAPQRAFNGRLATLQHSLLVPEQRLRPRAALSCRIRRDNPRLTAASSQRGQHLDTADYIWRRQRPQRLMKRWRLSSGRCDGNVRPNSSIFNHCLKQCALHTHVCISSTVMDVYGRVARINSDWDQGYIEIKGTNKLNDCRHVTIYYQV